PSARSSRTSPRRSAARPSRGSRSTTRCGRCGRSMPRTTRPGRRSGCRSTASSAVPSDAPGGSVPRRGPVGEHARMRTPGTIVLGLLLPAALAAQAPPPPGPDALDVLLNEQGFRAHLRFLASDLLEGRGPGTRGDELTQLYLQTRLEAVGLEPAGP